MKQGNTTDNKPELVNAPEDFSDTVSKIKFAKILQKTLMFMKTLPNFKRNNYWRACYWINFFEYKVRKYI